MAEPKQITIKEIPQDGDYLDDENAPRVVCRAVNEKGKEVKLTVFKKQSKETPDGEMTTEIIPQKGHTYMGYFKKPGINKETGIPYKVWSFNIAWEISNKEEPTEDETFPEEQIEDIPEQTHYEKDTIPTVIDPKEIEIRHKAAMVVAKLMTHLTKEKTVEDLIKGAKRVVKYYKTGE